MTPAQKGAQTRRRNAAQRVQDRIKDRGRELVDAIQALPPVDASLPALVQLFKPGDWEAFQMLDQSPGKFPFYLSGHWYALLRRARNRPELGLFKQMK